MNKNEETMQYNGERLNQLIEMRLQLRAAEDEPIVLKLSIGDKTYEYPIDNAQSAQYIDDFIANCENYHQDEYDYCITEEIS